MTRSCALRRIAFIVAAGLLTCGCGDALPRGEVTGQVTYDGEPVTGGVVVFVPQRGPQARGVLDEDGRYRLETPTVGDGAVVGDHTVFIQPLLDESPLADYTAEDELNGVPPPRLPSLLHPPLPARLLSPHTSDLRANVAPGANQHDWQLPAPSAR